MLRLRHGTQRFQRYFSNAAVSVERRGVERPGINYNVGETLHGFTVKRIEEFPDFELRGVEFYHEKTGAKYYHIDASDTENMFAVSFRTIPGDDTGVPHILEHTVLCGSENYPVRDPFFNMLKRSLQTFMNAFTSSDWTAYPFSTQNSKDYKNLLSVYLDATFFPNLRHNDFLQEGHRFEFSEKENPESQLKYSGVVYNEMKGVFSDPERIFMQKLQTNLFPDVPYRYCSGGDPKDIPNLTYEQFCAFHKEYYHPCNSNIFTYGDLPPHLEQLNQVLSRFEKSEPVPPVPLQPLWKESRKIFETCPEEAMIPDVNRQTKIVRTWIGPSLDNFTDVFGFHILSNLLFDGPSSPFYRSLIEPNIGQSFASGSGFSDGSKQTEFGVGLSGIKKEDVEKVEKIIQETLEECVKTGFDPERIEAVIHQLELSQKHVSTQFGLSIFMRMITPMNHDVEPFDALRLNEYLDKLKAKIQSEPYFQNLIQKYLLDNHHSLTVIMDPDKEYLKNVNLDEEATLENIQKNLTLEEKEKIVKLNLDLESHQSEPQNAEMLPTLKVSDISRQGIYYDTEVLNVNGLTVHKSVQPTNGMVYLRGIVDAHALPHELRPYLPLFTNCLASMGAGNMDYRELSHQLKLKTGDIGCSTSAYNHYRGSDHGYAFHVGLTSSCLVRNLESMFHLYNLVLREPNFCYHDRLESILSDMALGESQSLVDSGHNYALTLAAQGFNDASALSEQISGLSQVQFINGLSAGMPNNLEDIVEKLNEIKKILLSQGLSKIMVTADEKTWNSGEIEKYVSTLPVGELKSYAYPKPRIILPSSKSYIAIPMQVNHNALVLPSIDSLHPDAAALSVGARLLRWNYLHQQIREKGGAYGSGAQSGSEQFSFFSYRDPNVEKTLETFENSIDWLCNGDNIKERDIEEALLSVFSGVDSPTAPSKRGVSRLLDGLSFDLAQAKRENLLDITREQVMAAAETHLKSQLQNAQVAVCGIKDMDLSKFEKDGFNIINVMEEACEEN